MMKQNKFQIQDLLRLQDINRWTVVATTKQQSIAEHTFNVVMIVRAVAKEAGLPDEDLIKMALEHDIDEIITGDIPTPGKKEIEKEYHFKFDSGGKNMNKATTDERHILKVSDLIEAYVFILEYGVGRYAKFTVDELDDKLNQYFHTMPKHLQIAVYNVLVKILEGRFTYK